jgi:hypothetical protein
MSLPWWLAEHDEHVVYSVLRQFDWATEFEVSGASASIAHALHRNGYVACMMKEEEPVEDGVRRYHIASGGLTDLGRALQEQCRGADVPQLPGNE